MWRISTSQLWNSETADVTILANRFQDASGSRNRHRNLLEEWDSAIDVKEDITLGS